jgi:hypothetical protein
LVISKFDPGFLKLSTEEIQRYGMGYRASECISEIARKGNLADFSNHVAALIWPGLDDRQIRELLEYSLIIHETGVLPVAADPRVLQHLDRCSRVLLDHGLPSRPALNVPSYEPAVRYHIPSLAHISLGDVIRIRRNEEVFQDLRTCLTRLAQDASAAGHREGYLAFSELVRSLAEDIVRPTYEKLEKTRRRAKTRSILWDWASGGLLSLGMRCLGTFAGVPGPAVSTVDTVAKIGRKQVTKRLLKNQRDLELAGSVLYSLMD